MANRYLVGLGSGARTWNSSNTNLWSTSSGGSSGASVPTGADDVIFDANSGSANALTLSGNNINCRTLVCTGFVGTVVGTSSVVLSFWGPTLTFSSGMTTTGLGGSLFAFNANCAVTMNGQNANLALYIPPGATATVTLQDAFNCTGSSVQNGFAIYSATGAINTNGKTCTVGVMVDAAGGTWTFGASTITVRDGVTLHPSSTVNAGTSTIILDPNGGTMDTTFDGGSSIGFEGKTFNAVRLTNGTFAFDNDDGNGDLVCSTLTLDSGITVSVVNGVLPDWTLTTLSMSGVTWGSGGFGPPNLIATSGTKTATNCSIELSTVSGGATFLAIDSTDVDGNSGWSFFSSLLLMGQVIL